MKGVGRKDPALLPVEVGTAGVEQGRGRMRVGNAWDWGAELLVSASLATCNGHCSLLEWSRDGDSAWDLQIQARIQWERVRLFEFYRLRIA